MHAKVFWGCQLVVLALGLVGAGRLWYYGHLASQAAETRNPPRVECPKRVEHDPYVPVADVG